MTDAVVVFNGDILTQIDLASVIRMHRERKAQATIVLTPVENPSAYGLVETEADGTVRRFVEKPSPDEITTNHINAGIYVLEPETFDRIPSERSWSIERSYFPSLVERREMFVAYVYDGYWIDIGTPEKYLQVHRDIMDGRYQSAPFTGHGRSYTYVAPGARIEEGAIIQGPGFIDEGAVVKAGARIGPYSVIGRQCHIEEGAQVESAVVWQNTRVGRDASITGAIVGRNVHVGRNVSVGTGAVLGDKTALTDYTRT